MKKEKVINTIKKISGETHFAGIMDIGGVIINFNVVLSIPISELAKMTHPTLSHAENLKAICSHLSLLVKKGEEAVELSVPEALFFTEVLYGAILKAWRTDATIKRNDANDTTFSDVGIMIVEAPTLSPENRRMFYNKFGCNMPN